MTKGHQDVARRPLRRNRVGAFFAAVIVLAPTLVVGLQIGAEASPKKTHVLSASASPCTMSQLAPSISATIETDSSSSIVVVLATSLQNISKRSCSIDVGPTSPNVSIENPDGTLAWNNCYVGDEPGACPLFLELKTLRPKALYSWTATWPPSPSSDALPLPGTYTFAAGFSGVGSPLVTHFVLAN